MVAHVGDTPASFRKQLVLCVRASIAPHFRRYLCAFADPVETDQSANRSVTSVAP
jgi:hypothetical protein